MRNIFQKNNRGFSLVELIIAMSVFTVLITIATGVFVRVIKTQRDLVTRLSIIDNAGLVLEQMTREIRTGYDFSIANPNLVFQNREGKQVQYLKNNDKIVRIVEGDSFELTSPNVKVKELNFVLAQENNSKCSPWRITIFLKVGSEKLEEKDDILLQTTISSRVLPVEMPNVSQEILNNCNLYD
jgi:prepilin-type N-terminal cleavage/methylation domain-containing protein